MHEGHFHNHEHTHEHNHEHHHDHEHIQAHAEDLVKTRTLLTYMLEHNRHHADELKAMVRTLIHLEQYEAAALITEGTNFFSDGNDKLEAALEQLKEEI